MTDSYAAAGRVRARRLSRRDALATATESDRRLLSLLVEQRVLTQTQLERLLSDIPARTLRYRTERLTRLGLVGRSRPYRDKGSAPFHYWPTRVADTSVRGEPVARGGERPEPNPMFLHHAERLSEVYVLLATVAPSVGLRLRRFAREGDARESFRVAGRERALAPDALIEFEDDTGRTLLGFLELDLGTMSHSRLKTKAAGYAAYAAEAAWTERHPFCPCLLFLTTTETRAISFLKTTQSLIDQYRRHASSIYGRRGNLDWFAAGASAHARQPERALLEACWDNLTLSGGGLTLADCLNAARAPYDAVRAKHAAEQRALEAERELLRTNPEARRSHLQEKRLDLHGSHLVEFGQTGQTALMLLLAARGPMTVTEQDAFVAFARQLDDDPLEARLAPIPVPPTWADEQAVAALVSEYRTVQRARVSELTRRYGEGPQLRSDQHELAAGGLIGRYGWDTLEERARRDHNGRVEQDRLRLAYLNIRDRDARQRRHETGLATRLARGRTAVLELVDKDKLRICGRCHEIAYPPELPEPVGYGSVPQHAYQAPTRCHFCRGSELNPWDELYQPELEYGAAGALTGTAWETR